MTKTPAFPDRAVEPGGLGGRVALVSHDAVFLLDLQATLEACGFSTWTANNGCERDGTDAGPVSQVDAAIIDVGLGDESAAREVEWIESHAIPTIVVSDEPQPQPRPWVVEHVSKPLRVDDLVPVVARLMGNSGAAGVRKAGERSP